MSKFRAMRRHRQQLSQEESISIFERATSGTLALLGDDDYPYAVPISFVYREGCLYFHSAVEGHKIDAIQRHDKASFCVIDQDNVQGEKYTTYFRSVIAFGHVSIIEDAEDILSELRRKSMRFPGKTRNCQFSLRFQRISSRYSH